MTEREALKLALEWIRSAPHGDNCFLHDDGEYNRCFCGKDSLQNFINEVLAQTEQEPYGYLKLSTAKFFHEVEGCNPKTDNKYLALYIKPPQRKPLTVCKTCDGTGIVKNLHNWATGGTREEACWNCYREDA